MQRAAISVPANIAEGHGRPTTRDYLKFLAISCGSLRELDTYTEVCLALEYGEASHLQQIRERSRELEKMLWGLRSALQKREGA